MPTLIVLVAVPALIAVALYQLYQNFTQDRALSHIPTHEFEDGDNSRERYISDLKYLLESGYRKYNKHGKPFKVKIPVGGYSVKYRVVLPKDHLEEMKHLSNNAFSWALASAVIFAQDYTGAPPRGPWSGKALRVGIHQNLGDITKKLDQQIDDYFAAHLPQDPELPGQINFMDFFVPAIANVTNSLLVDKNLSSNPEWVRQTCGFAVNRYKSADDVRAYPPYIATLAAPWIPSVRRLRQSRRYVREKMTSVYEDLKRRQISGTLSKEKCRKSPFGFEWLWGGAPEDVTLDDFSDTMMRTLIASIHTTAKTVSVALIDLLSQPRYISELRQEALDARRPDGSVDIDKLFKMDCFLKESQRLTPVFLCKSKLRYVGQRLANYTVVTMNRIVTQPYTFKVSGSAMPVGTMTTAATAAIATDPDTFGVDSNGFDGHRFERLRLDNKAGESALKMGMATEDSLGFGLGSQACPGRFFAVNQIKLILAKLLTRWELTLEKNGQKWLAGRPKYEYYDFSVVAPAEFGVQLKRYSAL